jgi:hypothetical protein
VNKKFASQLKAMKEREYQEGLKQGMDFDLLIMEIVLNNLYQYGSKRFAEIEAERDRVLMEEVQGKEPELLIAQLERRLNQMR